MRVMILAHGHPALSPGGAERAAYALFEHLKADPGFPDPSFVARAAAEHIGHSAPMGAFRGRRDEILVTLPGLDHLTQTTRDYNTLRRVIERLVGHFRPDLVHVHHFVHVGVDVFGILRDCGVKVVLTLHEYIPICHNYGQMVKTDGRNCYAASPAECGACFPGITPGWFFLRERIVKSFLENVDHFIAPSRFLADRYVAWGLTPGIVTVAENPLAPGPLQAAAPPPARPRGRLRVAFFGQITPFKGLDVLLRAVALLGPEARAALDVSVYGANLELQRPEFRGEIVRLAEEVRDTVSFLGAYDNRIVGRLMAEQDWIVVPSIWWENSPVVIQEALLAGRPVLCARMGGMEEKVEDGVTGLHFEGRSPASLAAALTRIAERRDEILPSPEATADRHARAAARIAGVYRALSPPAAPAGAPSWYGRGEGAAT